MDRPYLGTLLQDEGEDGVAAGAAKGHSDFTPGLGKLIWRRSSSVMVKTAGVAVIPVALQGGDLRFLTAGRVRHYRVGRAYLAALLQGNGKDGVAAAAVAVHSGCCGGPQEGALR